jgi:hypothetical protein
MDNGSFQLIDNYGLKQYIDTSLKKFKMSNYKLLNNGYWIALGRPGEDQYKYYLLTQDIKLVDSIPLSPDKKIDIHDVIKLKNGNYLILYTYNKIVDMSKMVPGGNPQAEIKISLISETDNTGQIYWEWDSWEHMQLTDATPDIDLTSSFIEFPHINTLWEDTDGNLIVSFRHADEISKIDRKTKEFIWRMGGSKCKNNQFTFQNDTENGFTGFSHQHSIAFLENGNMLMYDNGNLKDPQYSRAVEYQVNTLEKKVTKVWEYRYSPDIYISSMGSAYRLANGNTLINWGNNKITEVAYNKEIVFEMNYIPDLVPYAIVYQVHRYVTRMNSVQKDIVGAGEYVFNDEKYHTGTALVISSSDKPGKVNIERHDYPPPSSVYDEADFNKVLPYRFVISSNEVSDISGRININTDSLKNLNKYDRIKIYKRSKEASGTFYRLETTYNKSTRELSADFNGLGEFALTIFEILPPLITNPLNFDTSVIVSGFVQWESSDQATGYRIQVSKDPDFTDILSDKITGNTWIDYSNLNYESYYYCRAKAFNITDTSEWSATITFKTMKIPIVKLISPEDNTTGFSPKGTLQWGKIKGIVNYHLQIATDLLFQETVTDEKSLSDTFYILPNLTSSTIYYWRVRVANGSILSAWSDIFNFETGPTAIFESDNKCTWEIYPVPARDFVYLKSYSILNENSLKVRIINAIGETLVDLNYRIPGSEKIDISFLPFGIYTIVLEEGNYNKQMYKIIKY